MIKSAAEHLSDISKVRKSAKREQRQYDAATKAEQVRLETYEYMRDELMGAVAQSGMSFEDIHGRCGPHPSTLQGYKDRTTRFPQMKKMQSTAKIIGMRWMLVPMETN